MHFPSLSATLPRRWRLSNTDAVSSDKKPPKPSSSLRRRLSSLSTTSSASSSYGAPSQKPPKNANYAFSSHLSRSSSFNSSASLEPSNYHSQKTSLPYDSISSMSYIHSKKSGSNATKFDFKKPLPPPPKSHSQRRSFLQGVLVNRGESSPFPLRRSSDTVPARPSASTNLQSTPIPSAKEWKSQSLVDLNGNKSETSKNHTLIDVQPETYRSNKTCTGKTSFSKPFHTFGTPQIKRKLSVPTYLSSSLTESKNSCRKNTPSVLSSSQDGINKLSKELTGSNSSLSRPGISTATIFSKNLRSNSWRNLSLIGKVEPIRHDQKDLCKFMWANKNNIT